MISVTFLTGEYPPMQGGIADHTAHLARHMAPFGIEATVLINRRWQHTADSYNGSRPPVAQAAVFPVIPNWGWRCWPTTHKFITQHQPDILHIQYQAAAFDLGGWVHWLPRFLKKRQCGKKIVTTFHDLRIPYIFPKAGPLRWRSVLALARYSDAIICTNREDLYQLSEHLDNHRPGRAGQESINPHLTLIHLGSNVEPQPPADFNRQQWRAKYGLTDNTLLLTFFGFLNDSKGGEELIEALAQVRRQGLDAHLLLIGGDVGHADPTNAAQAQKIQALIEQQQLTAVVHRTGFVELPEVSANLQAADAVVMPYRDGVSFRRTTLIAALRHGCAIISTEPASPELTPEIQSGENMLLTPPRDAAALANAIAQLHQEPALRQKLAEGARSLGQQFEWNAIAGQTAALYQTLAGKHW